jgi:hypothetical protein
VDFNLQIPANAFIFVILLALGWVTLHLKGDRPHFSHLRESGSEPDLRNVRKAR